MYFELSHLLTYFYDKIAKATVKTLHITYMVHSSWVPTQISVIMHEIILENIISHQSMKKKNICYINYNKIQFRSPTSTNGPESFVLCKRSSSLHIIIFS